MTELDLRRRPTIKDTTFGDLFFKGVYECHTLEDAIREIPGRPVAEWKIQNKTAITAGRYELVLEDSPRFGKDTLTLVGVIGFKYIRIHGGNDDADTDGCIIVGYGIVEDPEGDGGNLAAGTSQPALLRLKNKLVPLLKSGERCFINVYNPE